MFVVSALATACFLGGWHVPFLDAEALPVAWGNLFSLGVFLAKALGLVLLMMWIRWTLPRLRVDQLMRMSWKYLVPITFFNLLGVSLWLLVFHGKGMRITARYGVDPRETITLQYPEERWEPSERFRGFLHNDIKRCTSCTMCVKVCPVDCISLESVRGADKKLVLVSYDINIGRCMYCGLCVEVCPPKSLTHTSGYEKATVDRGELILHFIEEEADEVKARVAKQVAEKAAKEAAEKAGKEEADKAAKAAGGTKPPGAPPPPG